MKFNPYNFQEQVKPGIGYYPALAWIFLLCPLKDEIRLTSSTHDEMKMLFCGGENFGADRAIKGRHFNPRRNIEPKIWRGKNSHLKQTQFSVIIFFFLLGNLAATTTTSLTAEVFLTRKFPSSV